MTASDAKDASRPSRRLLIVGALIWLVLTFAVPAAAPVLNLVGVAGFPLGFWMTAQGCLAGLAVLAIGFAWFAGGRSSENAAKPALALAAEALGAAGVIGFAGAIAALGFDGLALPLGLTAGLAFMAMFVAPRFVLYPVDNLGEFFAVRFDGAWSRRVAVMIALAASVVLLAADLRGVALALQGLVATPYAASVAIATAAIAVIFMVRMALDQDPHHHLRAPAFVIIAVCLAVPLLALALRHGSFPVPYLSYGYAMTDLAAIEQRLIESNLSDYSSLHPMASPFLRVTIWSFVGAITAVALGVAVVPHVLGRHLSFATVTAGDAPRRAAYGTALVAVMVMALAAMAAFGRVGVATELGKGIEVTAVPQSLQEMDRLGWVSICARAETGAATIADACARDPEQRGFLRAQDLRFSVDGFVLAAPAIAGVPFGIAAALWVALLLAALLAGYAIVSSAVVLAQSRFVDVSGASLDVRSALTVVALLLGGAALVVLTPLQISTLVTSALALLAAGLFPAVILGLYWRRMSNVGALAAMLTGTTIVALYSLGTQMFPVAFVDWFGALSGANPEAVLEFTLLQDAVADATTAQERVDALAALREQAGIVANIAGLTPVASVLIAVPMALLAGGLGSWLSPAQSDGG